MHAAITVLHVSVSANVSFEPTHPTITVTMQETETPMNHNKYPDGNNLSPRTKNQSSAVTHANIPLMKA